MHVVGVDENGLGPVLGPLVATAVAMEGPAPGRYPRARLQAAGAKAGIQDSKETAAAGKMAHAEGIALALAERMTGTRPAEANGLLAAVSLEPPEQLRRPCPGADTAAQCWAERLPLPAFGGDPVDGHDRLDRIERGGWKLHAVRSAIACAGVLNRELDRGRTKVGVDLALFERLMLDARRRTADELLAVCGMVGGIRRYPGYMTHLADHSMEVRRERRDVCCYRVGGLGELRFERDADARHLPVGLASMMGKYLREIAMERINRFYASHVSTPRRASGYRDPVTRHFVEQTATVRKRLRIADDCFERKR